MNGWIGYLNNLWEFAKSVGWELLGTAGSKTTYQKCRWLVSGSFFEEKEEKDGLLRGTEAARFLGVTILR